MRYAITLIAAAALTSSQLAMASEPVSTEIAACRPGDEILLASPYFPASRDLFAGLGLTMLEVRLTFDNRYQIDPAAFLPLLSSATRLVSLATSQNPSGVTTPMLILEELLDLMKVHAPKALLFVDESGYLRFTTERSFCRSSDPTPRRTPRPTPKAVGRGDRHRCRLAGGGGAPS